MEGESGATDADEATGLPRDGPPTQLRGTAVGMWDKAVKGEGEKACYYGQGRVTADSCGRVTSVEVAAQTTASDVVASLRRGRRGEVEVAVTADEAIGRPLRLSSL